jgi:hypothetical protein
MPEVDYYLSPHAAWQGLFGLGVLGARSIAPNLLGLLAGDPAPPLPNIPEMTPTGKIPPTTDPHIPGAGAEAAEIGMSLLPLGGLARTAGGYGILGLLRRDAIANAEALASRSVSLYNPPVKAPRPFAADYPSGAPGDAAGRLTKDIEGRALTARYVVGRKVVGGDDIPFAAAELDALTKAGTGKLPEKIAPSKIGGAAGVLAIAPSGRPTDLFLSNKLTPEAP